MTRAPEIVARAFHPAAAIFPLLEATPARQVTVDPELATFIPPLTPDELRGLEASLLAEGCRDALVIWRGTLLDGHNRLAICERHGLEHRTVEIDLPDRDAAKLWLVDNQLARRNLNAWQRGRLQLLREPLVAAQARARMLAGKEDPGQNIGQGRTDERLGEAAGVSDETIRKVRILDQRGDAAAHARLDSGATSIDAEFKALTKPEVLAEKRAAVAAERAGAIRVPPQVALSDWRDWLPQQPPCDLLLTDPPYSTDIPDIMAFAAEWLPQALAKVKPTGRAYVFIGPYPREVFAYLAVAMPDQILDWTYRNTMGPAPTHTYKNNVQRILYYCGPEAAPLNCPLLVEHFSVHDVAQPAVRHHPWQKPDELCERLVRHASKVGDLVLDPFAGSGSFLLAAGVLGREARGCEIDPSTHAIALSRGCTPSPSRGDS